MLHNWLDVDKRNPYILGNKIEDKFQSYHKKQKASPWQIEFYSDLLNKWMKVFIKFGREMITVP